MPSPVQKMFWCNCRVSSGLIFGGTISHTFGNQRTEAHFTGRKIVLIALRKRSYILLVWNHVRKHSTLPQSDIEPGYFPMLCPSASVFFQNRLMKWIWDKLRCFDLISVGWFWKTASGGVRSNPSDKNQTKTSRKWKVNFGKSKNYCSLLIIYTVIQSTTATTQ